MAEGKKSFLLYCDILEMVEELPMEKRGELFTIILQYVNDKNPVVEELLLKTAFAPIKMQLKRDLKRYESIVESRRIAGLASADKRKQNQQVLTSVNRCQQDATNSTDNDTDNDNDTGIDIEERKDNTLPKQPKRFVKPTVSEIDAYCNKRKNGINANRFYDYYEAKGWKVGKSPMKDWMAAVRTWENTNESNVKQQEFGYDFDSMFPQETLSDNTKRKLKSIFDDYAQKTGKQLADEHVKINFILDLDMDTLIRLINANDTGIRDR
jgi:hypothetical protein